MKIKLKEKKLNSPVNKYRFLFAGGGTGGHLFPAVAVAETIKQLKPESEILFVGTKSKIEGRVIPALGYKFKSVWIKGFSRKFTFENLLFPLKLIVSVVQSLLISMEFKPKVAVGSGGYASGPAVWSAAKTGAKVVLLEQNSFPGVTTKILQKYADEIHISFKESEKHFSEKEKIIFSGNPVRNSLSTLSKEDALKSFGFDSGRRTLLVIGGSLGAKTLNESVANALNELQDIQIIWQTGKNYFDENKKYRSKFIWINQFIDEMNIAYSAADLVLARAGATTIAEITTLGLASILVPSPNVAANHQYFNAKSLADENAAILIEDKELKNCLASKVKLLISDDLKLNQLKANALKLGKPNAAEVIAKRAINLAEQS